MHHHHHNNITIKQKKQIQQLKTIMMKQKRIYTDTDLAIEAGVHPNTVTRYNRLPSLVNNESRLAIEKAKRKLDKKHKIA